MNDTLLTNSDRPLAYYAVKVNGVVKTNPMLQGPLLEQALNSLPENERQTAVVVPVTPDGREILCG